MEIILITGPAGVGKSTLCWEMSLILSTRNVPHAVIETDELDRVFPRPTIEELERLRPGTSDVSAINLAAIWSTYQSLGHTRLIMSGVMMHPHHDHQWIRAAIPEANITTVRLTASESTLLERLNRREVGTSADEQMQRSLRQSRYMSHQDATGFLVLSTEDTTTAELAEVILQNVGWLPTKP